MDKNTEKTQNSYTNFRIEDHFALFFATVLKLIMFFYLNIENNFSFCIIPMKPGTTVCSLRLQVWYR